MTALGSSPANAWRVSADHVDIVRPEPTSFPIELASTGSAPAFARSSSSIRTAASRCALGMPEGLFSLEEQPFGIHAGAADTSMMMHLRPDMVRRDKRGTFPSAWHPWPGSLRGEPGRFCVQNT
jgi:hypothetical protein